MWFYNGPCGNLPGIGEQHTDDCSALGSLLDGEERLARYPSVGHRLVESLALALSDNDVEAVVAQVTGLSGTLYAIADDGDGLVFQYFTCFFQ